MRIFNNKQPQKSAVALLIEESDKHMNVFKTTADGLKDVNQKIEVEQDRISDEIRALQIQHESLQDTKNANARTEQKIRAFLED